MFDMAKMMAQAKKVQDKMGKIQQDLEHLEIVGKSADGLVKIVCNGKFEFKSVNISVELVQKGDNKAIEKAVMEALEDCTNQIMKYTQDKMESLTAGLNIPGLKLPF